MHIPECIQENEYSLDRVCRCVANDAAFNFDPTCLDTEPQKTGPCVFREMIHVSTQLKLRSVSSIDVVQ